MAIPPDPPALSTPAIVRIWRQVHRHFGRQVTSLGVYNCRRVRGGTGWSQHAWANAWDIAGPPEVLDRVARFLRSDRMRPWVAEVIWRQPLHYDHVHVSGRPLRHGIPPCARGRARPAPEEVPPGVEGTIRGPAPTRVPIPRPQVLVSGESAAGAIAAARGHFARGAGAARRVAAAIEATRRRG